MSEVPCDVCGDEGDNPSITCCDACFNDAKHKAASWIAAIGIEKHGRKVAETAHAELLVLCDTLRAQLAASEEARKEAEEKAVYLGQYAHCTQRDMDGGKYAHGGAAYCVACMNGVLQDRDRLSLELSAHQAAIIALRVLRRRGAWLPGDPVTDAMAKAGWAAFHATYNETRRFDDPLMRAAISAALAARAKP